MNFDKPTDEQLGLKKKNAEGLDIESAELVPETEEVLKRVNIKHPEMVLEIALAGRDIKRAEAYEQSLQNDPEALQVWKAIKKYSEDYTGALETWLDSYAALNTLPLDSEDGEPIDLEDYEKAYIIPRIQRVLQEKPIVLTDFLRALKLDKLELDAIPGMTPEQETAGLAKSLERITADKTAQETAEEAIQKAGDEARAEELTAQAQADEILKKIQGM